ncbi:MAG TPA: glycosyltransferase [Nocardioides sp.]|nr:glycosyltransferase [Nocardioides sp.]
MRSVEVGSIPLDRLASLLDKERAGRLMGYAVRGRRLLAGRVVWNVNATATGGGVAEMLQALLAYSRGAGVDTRWLVLDAPPEFFRITKRVHNLLHGSPGDGGPLGPAERAAYEAALAPNLEHLLAVVRPQDVVLLHDPQTAGLVPGLRAAGLHAVWRSHVGRDTPNELTEVGWEFLRPYVELSEAMIFSRPVYAPEWVGPDRLWSIPPSLDPFTAKNRDLANADVEATLSYAGLVAPDGHPDVTFTRRDGRTGMLRRHRELVLAGGPVPDDARVVLQVSRWDRLKDMPGVLAGFVARLPDLPPDVHLMLVGPDVSGVTDDPEGAEVLEECLADWRAQPEAARARVHLCSLPMDDVDENAHLVNALQHHAAVVVQKSLVEGFGLTVTEPMWKARPVVASRVGGIQDQIVHGHSGLLLDDPTDLDELGDRIAEVLGDRALAHRLGTAARERVREQFLGDRHLTQYVDLFERVLTG